MINSPNQLSKSMRLILAEDTSSEGIQLLYLNIGRVLNVAQIYHLEIFEDIVAGLLNEMLLSLLELDSLRIDSLIFSSARLWSNEEREVLSSISKKNKITKVNLLNMVNIEDVYFLIQLCPRMTYLKVDCINKMDVEVFVRSVLTKSNHRLRLLCFRITAADNEMIRKLDKMIHNEKLLLDYTIKREFDDIYLQWK